MTDVIDFLLGEDIKELLKHNPDCFNISDTKDIDNHKLYSIKKHIGYYEPKKRSGIFIKSIKEVTEETIEKDIW